jgi:uncharacterized repeat protein (TIGR01451 family)
MKTLRTILVFITVTSLLIADVTTAQALRASPSGFHGSVKVNGSNVSVNTFKTVRDNNVQDSQLDQTAIQVSTSFTCTTLDSKPATASTGEKPQSKVWTYAGSWFAVFPTTTAGASSAGTWVWRLVGTTWTEVLRLSTRTNTHADVLVDGPLVHILLWAGNNSQLSSIEYVGVTYKPWADRSTSVDISLPGSETATIALDSTGEMWLATRASNVNIVVYHSAPPYSTWDGPIVLETGVFDDDIEVITALPNGSVGVFWSNQITKRFGFRTHVDGGPATTWSVNEVPASQSALNVGSGMADDHMNVAVASDSTLYVAIKTSYDSSSYPKMALLVRRPDGTWDDLYPVDNSGTRPLVLLDENNDSLIFIYTSSEGNNSIVYQQTSTQRIAFDESRLLRSGSFNDVSSMKSNIKDGFVVIYSTSTEISGQYCSMETGVNADLAVSVTGAVSAILPGDSLTNTITATNHGPDDVVNAIVADTMSPGIDAISWSCIGAGGGTCTASGSGSIYDTVNLPAGATVTYKVQAEVALGVGGRLTNTATITTPIGTIDPTPDNNRSSFTYTLSGNLTCETDPTLVGCWQMEENSGTLLLDGSTYANNATLYGGPTWVAGRVGSYAIDLNGTSQYALVPDNASLDIADQITVMAWIRPEQYATQDLIKKATQGSINGYELSLATTKSDASSQRAFFRINQQSNGDTYRVNAATIYPIDGTWMHVAATYDGSAMRLYINGVEEGNLTVPGGTTIALNNVPLSIGAQSTPSRYFRGWMDDARVYHHALSLSEIQAIINPPPVAADDTYDTPEDTWLTVSAPGVLSNDTDADLDPLTAIKVTDPAHGSLALNPDGSFTYKPEANWNGTDSFTYKANDTQVDSNTATVTVNVSAVNDAPVLGEIGSKGIAELEPLLFTATAADVDLPADTLTYSLADGTAGSVPEGAAIGSTGGDFSWTPTEAQGPESFTFDVCGSDGFLSDCETISVAVSEVATSPMAVPDAYDVMVNSILVVAAPGVLANDSDMDIPVITLAAVLDTPTAHGDLTFFEDGSFTYSPDAMWSGMDTFTYNVYDGTSDSEIVSVTITVKLWKFYLLIISKEY